MKNSRKIAFRAWHKEKNKMISWNDFTDYVDPYLGNEGFEWAIDAHNNKESALVLMQYTGLKDKNGVDIYEGDILKLDLLKDHFYGDEKFYAGGYTSLEYSKVTFDKGGYWRIDSGSLSPEEVGSNLGLVNKKGIVAGNIYENPELLGGTT